MGLIAIEGMKFYAYHGYYPQEQLIGTDYIVDVYVGTDMKKVAKSDDLTDTVNYETIYRISKGEMAKNSKLIETVAQRIIDRIKSLYSSIETLKVRISKLNPPLGSTVSRTFTELEEDYRKQCGKCKKDILVQIDGACWDNEYKILAETKSTLIRNYGNNLCEKCLEPYLVKYRDEASAE